MNRRDTDYQALTRKRFTPAKGGLLQSLKFLSPINQFQKLHKGTRRAYVNKGGVSGIGAIKIRKVHFSTRSLGSFYDT